MMRVTQIWRYPVKSVGGHRVNGASIGELGIDGDRAWGVVDDATGYVLTGRREPRLLMATAVIDNEGKPVITTADGHEIHTGQELSDWLGRPVTLVPAGDEGGTHENPLDFENDDQWHSWQGAGGAWHDSPRTRVSIVSSTTLGDWDPRRFRANVVVDGSGEDELVGSDVVLGSAVLAVTKRINRCVMVTRPQPGLDHDLDVLRTINRERDSCLAVGAVVTTPGRIVEGDDLTIG